MVVSADMGGGHEATADALEAAAARLSTQSVPISSAASAPLFATGLVASLLWFRRAMKHGGYVLAWGHPTH